MSTIKPLVLDIETIPARNPEHLAYIEESWRDELAVELDAVRAPSNYKDEAKIAEFVSGKRGEIKAAATANFETLVHKTGLDGALGELVVVGMVLPDRSTAVFKRRQDVDGPLMFSKQSEIDLLKSLFTFLRETPPVRLVGHGIINFDLPFIWKRAFVLGIRPPSMLPREPKPWSDEVFDTMTVFAGSRNTIKLDKLCRALGVKSPKTTMSGADVWPAIQAGRINDVADYCVNGDCVATRACYDKLTFSGD